MRLIDADALLEATSHFCDDYNVHWTDQKILSWINHAPTIDAVPVVRCRECKWFNTNTMECECDDVATDHEGGASFSINFGPDDFCSYGERKGGNSNG